MTKWKLFDSMCHGTEIVLESTTKRGKTYRGIVNTIQREDGSGHNFNVTLDTSDVTVFVRTID
mgnify:FL=1